MRRLLFLGTIALLIFYTGLCIHRLWGGPASASMMASAFIIIAIIYLQIFYREAPRPLPFEKALMWGSSVLLGLWSSFILFCIFIDLVSTLLTLTDVLAGTTLTGSGQWVHSTITLAVYVSLLTTFLGLLQAVRGPVIKKIPVSVASLPPELSGVKIVQISDLHIGSIIRKRYIEDVVREVQRLAPDLIAVTGDMADGTPADLHAHTQPLAGLSAPLGTYYITGNHEYYSGVYDWIAEATRLGFIPLINEHRIVTHRGKKIMVAGVTDLTAHYFIPEHRSDPGKAAATHEPVDFRLLLAHQPESYKEAEAAGFDLQLSGHTHGGQFFPFNLLVWLAKRYARGLHRYKSLWIYVNPGTGFWGAANRFGVPAEITLITLAGIGVKG